MDLKELEYFKTVCEQKSITKAAHTLYMTPQGLSKVIKNMENELNVALFLRTAAGIQMTEAGLYLYEHLSEFLNPYHEICSEIRCIEQRQRHELDLLSAYGILRLVTPDCIVDFQKKYPHITLRYREYPDKQTEARFLRGEGNVAFTIGCGEEKDNKYIHADFMEKFEIQLLVNSEHPLSQKEKVSIQDLKGEKLFLESTEFHIHHFIMEKCRKAGFEPNLVFETSGFSLCHKMVQQNKGISVTLDFIFEDMKQNKLKAIPFADGPYEWCTYMLTRNSGGANPDIELFHNHVLQWLEKIKKNHIPR